jgi:hypothetical protein
VANSLDPELGSSKWRDTGLLMYTETENRKFEIAHIYFKNILTNIFKV